jgi:hypothetical protein
MAIEYVNKVTFGNVSSATITGINSDDMYELHLKNIQGTTNNHNIYFRFTISGTGQSSAIYNYNLQRMGAWFYLGNDDEQYVNMINFGGNQTYTYTSLSGIMQLYNFNSSSREPMITFHSASVPYTTVNGVWGQKGGAIRKNSGGVYDGIQVYRSNGNLAGGEMILYRHIQ